MAEAYGTLGATVPESDDYASGGADVPKAFKAYSDSFGSGQGAGKLLVVQSTGAAAWKAMKGDATLAADGTLTVANAAISKAKLAAGVGALTWYTPKIVAGEETRTSSSYGTMPTADEIKSVVVPEGGLVLVGYSAAVKTSLNNGNAAVFIGANQLKMPTASGAPAVNFAEFGTSLSLVTSGANGLVRTGIPVSSVAVSTGLALGSANSEPAGLCTISRLAAGTYDVSVQFKAEGANSVKAKERALWVAVLG